mmetsp:Transcript_6726/g.13948  ORF Transcript_6726/g.13948 Transcript_6726/m.13948 type:complete len:212 (+) Transcript_6726:329-964(+)
MLSIVNRGPSCSFRSASNARARWMPALCPEATQLGTSDKLLRKDAPPLLNMRWQLRHCVSFGGSFTSLLTPTRACISISNTPCTALLGFDMFFKSTNHLASMLSTTLHTLFAASAFAPERCSVTACCSSLSAPRTSRPTALSAASKFAKSSSPRCTSRRPGRATWHRCSAPRTEDALPPSVAAFRASRRRSDIAMRITSQALPACKWGSSL